MQSTRRVPLAWEWSNEIRIYCLGFLRSPNADAASKAHFKVRYCCSGSQQRRAQWLHPRGAVVRKLLGYQRFEGIAAAKTITRLYGASRLFVNFFQPSFKLAAKHREGAQVSKRYHPPQTPCERLLQAESTPETAKMKLREITAALDPLKLLEEMRAMQAHLTTLADGEIPPSVTSEAPDLAAFVAGLSSAWRAGEVRPTFSVAAKPRYLRSLQSVAQENIPAMPVDPPVRIPVTVAKPPERPQLILCRKRQWQLPCAHHGLAAGVSPLGWVPEYQLDTAVRVRDRKVLLARFVCIG